MPRRLSFFWRMKPQETYLEIKVGLFLLVGLAVVGGMVIQFGRFGEGLQGTYSLYVRFPDASGLTKGAEVLMSGARIGRVADDPRLLPYSDGVIVPLKIEKSFKIPASASFRVGSSGLLGDRYIQVLRGKAAGGGEGGEAFLPPGSELRGTREPGLDDFVRNSEQIMEEARELIRSLQSTVEKLDRQALSAENVANASSVLKSLRDATENISSAAKKGDELLSNLGTVSEDLKKATASASRMMQRAESGGGLLNALITDRKMAEDVRAFISNVRERGLLFYRDRSQQKSSRGH